MRRSNTASFPKSLAMLVYLPQTSYGNKDSKGKCR